MRTFFDANPEKIGNSGPYGIRIETHESRTDKGLADTDFCNGIELMAGLVRKNDAGRSLSHTSMTDSDSNENTLPANLSPGGWIILIGRARTQAIESFRRARKPTTPISPPMATMAIEAGSGTGTIEPA